MNRKVIFGVAVAAYLVLVVLVGAWLGLGGTELWIVRIGLALIGGIAAVVYYWYALRSAGTVDLSDDGGAAGGAAPGEADGLVREAQQRLAASALGAKGRIAHLPLFVVLGEEGSAKTSTVANAGLEMEHLAGQVYQDNNIIPTAAANLWFSRGAVFAEAGGKLLAAPGQLAALARRLRPGALAAAFGRGKESPRAAVVCVSCDDVLQTGGAPALARKLRGALEETAASLGVRLPVYVLFTKADRIQFFNEYAATLSNDEAGQVVGATVPPLNAAGGVYAEREAERLSAAFAGVQSALAARRLEFLPRESDNNKNGAVYEFPRELTKVRANLVQFLVELCRPSQLNAGPYLRGFYFSGVRAAMRQEAAARPAAQQSGAKASSATQAFQAYGMAQQAGPAAVVTRKVAQWLFLPHFFSDVLLADPEVMGAAGGRSSRLRRILLATAAGLALFYAIALTVSFFGNRALEKDVERAAVALGKLDTSAPVPALDTLQKLDTLRQSVAVIAQYHHEGAPWRLRWGLWQGAELYEKSRRVYFARFHVLLFGGTQARLAGRLARLPAAPAPSDDYGSTYDTLKAYLITTSHHDKSTREFLSPVLLRTWQENRPAGPEHAALVSRQFDFYSDELKHANPFSNENDALLIERGRHYLSQFAGTERIYQFMLAEAGRQNPAISFHRLFPEAAQAVVDSYTVAGGFTKPGFAFMQNAIRNADRFFAGEQWVLGVQASAGIDKAALSRDLQARYSSDYIAQWRAFLKAGAVVRYANLRDAAKKLNLLSGNQSPLLALFWLASQHTAVEDNAIKTAFQPVQFVVTPESKDKYIGQNNGPYMNGLISLSSAVEQAAGGTGAATDPAVQQVNGQAAQAKTVVRQLAQNFRIDQEGQTHALSQKLLEDPITYVEALVRALGPGELNGKGAAFCALYRDLLSKYPFAPNATRQATLAEVNAVFQPGQGSLWTFYDQALRNHLTKQGSLYVANPAGGIPLNAGFVQFFNRLAAVSDALYPGGSSTPRMSYKLMLSTPQGLQSLTVTIDGQKLSAQTGRTAQQTFVWPGSPGEARLVGKFGGGPDITFLGYDGLWAAFQFFGDADRWQSAGNTHHLEWILRQGRAGQPLRLPDGSALTVRFDVEMPGGAPVFQKGFLGGLQCVAKVAQ